MTTRALWAAVSFPFRSPSAPLLAYLASFAVAIPITALMMGTLGDVSRATPGTPLGRGLLPPDWWLRLEQHGTALASEFAPRTLGFAATLDAFAMFVDGPRGHALAIALAAVAFSAMWAAIWAVVLTRLAGHRQPGLPGALQAVRQWGFPLLVISLIMAIGVGAIAFAFASTPLWPLFTASTVLAAIAVDLARAHLVLTGSHSPLRSIRGALQLLWKRGGVMLLICLAFLLVHAGLAAGYGAGEVVGGARLGGWRAVALAQLYVLLRTALRLSWGAAFFSLAQQELGPAPR